MFTFSSIFKRNQPRGPNVSATLGREKVEGPRGELIIASAGAGPDPAKLPASNDQIVLAWSSRWQTLHQCGHHGPRAYQLTIFGLTTRKIKDQRFCPDCGIADAKQFIIRCCLCGLPIFPGDPVAIYNSEHIIKSSYVHSTDDVALGCCRHDCCISLGFFSGHWTPEGFQSYFM